MGIWEVGEKLGMALNVQTLGTVKQQYDLCIPAWGCCNTLPQTQRLKRTQKLGPLVLWVESLNSSMALELKASVLIRLCPM